jgi:hypothetical protein
MTIDNSASHKKTSYKGVIIFAIIALCAYGAWTKLRTDYCLIDASDAYENEWKAACKRTAKSESEGYANCVNDPNESTINCKSIWNPKRDASANCALPSTVADRIDSRLEKAKNFCVSYG